MIKVLGENYYVDLDEIENYLDMSDDSPAETISGGSETKINIIKFEMVKMMLDTVLTEQEDLDEKLGLAFIRNLETVSFNFDHRDRYVRECGYEYGTKDNTLADPKKSYGFIAQQMKQLVESLDTTFDAVGYTEEQDAYRLTYEAMIAPLVKAVQQTSQRLETLEALAA